MLKKMLLFLLAIILTFLGNAYAFNQSTVYHTDINTSSIRSFPIPYNQLYIVEQQYGGKNKQTVLKDIKIASKYVGKKTHNMFPISPIGSFNGNLKKTGTIKIVFGLSGSHIENFFETTSDIYYIIRYAKLHNERYKIKFVIYGAMAKILSKKTNESTIIINGRTYAVNIGAIPILEYLYKHNVKIYVCYNALIHNHLVKHLIPSYVKPVPMGILKIYTLRKQGYMYFTNP